MSGKGEPETGVRVGAGDSSREQPASMGGQLNYLPALAREEGKGESKGEPNNIGETSVENTVAQKMTEETKTEANKTKAISWLEKAALSLLLFK